MGAPTEADASFSKSDRCFVSYPAADASSTETKKAEADQAEGRGFGDSIDRYGRDRTVKGGNID